MTEKVDEFDGDGIATTLVATVLQPGSKLSGLLRVLRTGAPWTDLPDRNPPYERPRVVDHYRDGGSVARVRGCDTAGMGQITGLGV